MGEKAGGLNIADANVDAYSSVVAAVAARTGAVFVDVRTDAVAYVQAVNVGVSGGLEWGVLTVDTVHPCQAELPPCLPHTYGNYVIANAFARGILQALQDRSSTSAVAAVP
jgi:hypothetical protein